MSWDPALLRKYTTTSHLKLLSQVRSELREQPIQRPLVTSRSKTAAGSAARRAAGRSAIEIRPVQNASTGSSAASAAIAPSSPSRSSTHHNVTRRRSTAPAVVSAPAHEEHHQPILAVPVLMDPALHGHH
jgi:hypothetical protein